MKFTTITTLVYPLLSLLSLAVFAAPLESRDVYSPPILEPNENTVWIVGEQRIVRWDMKGAPAQITNNVGLIELRQGDSTSPNPLASGFPIVPCDPRTRCEVEITVPDVDTGIYQVVLFGDSGNFSKAFRIINRGP